MTGKLISRIMNYIKHMIYRAKMKNKKRGLVNESISIHDSAIIFPETQISALAKGKISIGEKSCVRGRLLIIMENGEIEIGDHCYIGSQTNVWGGGAKIKIGNHVLIAHNCNIFDNDTHPIDYLERRENINDIIYKGKYLTYRTQKKAPICIKDDVWIGANVSIMKGVSIGERTIVATGSVVTKSFPADVIIAGNPAEIVKSINS